MNLFFSKCSIPCISRDNSEPWESISSTKRLGSGTYLESTGLRFLGANSGRIETWRPQPPVRFLSRISLPKRTVTTPVHFPSKSKIYLTQGGPRSIFGLFVILGGLCVPLRNRAYSGFRR